MGLRQRRWAKKERDRLLKVLGEKCALCGTTKDLEFDLIIPVGNDAHHRKMEWSWRISFYRKQHDFGNVQILCSHHNGKKKNNPHLTLLPIIDCPF